MEFLSQKSFEYYRDLIDTPGFINFYSYNARPSRIRGVYNLQNNDYEFNRRNPSAKFRVMLLGQYLQDEIAVSKKLRLTLGVRLDHALYPDREKVPARVQQTKGFEKYSNASSSQPQLAPRLGFNWDVKGNQQFMIRGGSGIFNGRMPFAWLAYPYYNNGVNYGNVDTRPTGRVPLEKIGNQFRIEAVKYCGHSVG